MNRLGVALAPSKQISVGQLVELGLLAEGLGYHSIWVPETWGFDAASVLGILADRTQRIRVASGIFNVFSRSAALVAQTAATLQAISEGRFILGLGTSGPIVVENWHAVPYQRALRRTEEYVAVIRMALAGKRVNYDGSLLRLRDFRLQNPPDVSVPIFIAALGAKNVRLTGAIADGWLPVFVPRGHLGPLLGELRQGASSAGRDPAALEVAAYLPAMVGTRADVLLAQQVARYVGGMGTFYAEFMHRAGFGPEADAIREKWQSGDRRAAVDVVGDALLEFCTLGFDPATARLRLEQYRQQGVTLPIVSIPDGATAEEVADTLTGLTPQL